MYDKFFTSGVNTVRFIKKVTCGFVIIALSACSSLSTQFTKAEEPKDGQKARLRIVANMLVKAVPNKSCIDWSAPGAGTVFGGIVGSSGYRGNKIGIPGAEKYKKSSGEMYIAANQPFTLVLLSTPDSRYRCSVAGSFVPEANKDYEASVSINSRVCEIRIIGLSDGNKPVDVQKANECR